MSNAQQRIVEKLPISSTTKDRRLSYIVSIMGERANMQETMKPFTQSQAIGSRAIVVHLESFPGEVTRLIDEYKKPFHFRENISAQEWVRSLTYNEDQIRELLNYLLEDFGLDPTNENVEWLEGNIGQLMSDYERKYRVELTPENRSTLKNLIIKMMHDRICIKNLM